MSGLVAGAKKVPRKIFGREAASLDGRVTGLSQAVEGGRGRLDDVVVTSAAAVADTARMDGYSGNGGVTKKGVQVGSPAVSGTPSASPARIAVTGRTKRYA